jgi:hemin uptake protein HemP
VINARPITVTAATNTKTYDGTTCGAASQKITSGTLVGGDTASFSESYGNRNVGTSKMLTPAGSVVDGNSGANYAVTFVNDTTGVITARPITVTAATNTKTSDGATGAAATPTITSGTLVGGDTASFSETYANRNAATGKTLIPAGLVVDGNGGNNYAVTFVNNTTGVINARAITVTAATNTKVYDGTTSAAATPTITSGTLVGGDTANVNEAYTNKDVGTGKTLTPSGSVTDGNSGNNYAVTFVSTTNGTITARPITFKANDQTKLYGNTFTFTGTEFTIPAGSVALGETVTSVTFFSTGAAGGTLAGSYSITPSNAVISGGSSNYAITYQPGTMTVTARDAIVSYIGQTVFFTSGSSSTSAQVMLTASVQDSDGSGGSVSNATVTFKDLLTGNILASGVKVSTVAGSSVLTGTANTIVTLSTGQYGAQEYLIEVTLSGSYKNTQQLPAPYGTAVMGSPAYNAAHPTVAVLIPPTANSIQGTASIPKLTTSAGTYGDASGAGYAMGLKFNKGGTNPQGQIQLILQRTDGTYYVKSNSLTSLGFSNLTSNGYKDATVYTKASIYKVNPSGGTTSVDGNVTLRVDAHEGCTNNPTGCSPSDGDMIGFSVLSSKNSALYYSNNWVYDTPTLSWRTVWWAISPGNSAVVIN